MPKHKVRHVKFSPEEMAYEIPEELDFSKLTPIIGRGIHAAEYQGEPPLKVAYVVVDQTTVTYMLQDGRAVSAPLNWYPRLQHATPPERNDWSLILGGRAVIWRSLGIAIAAKAIFEGTKANEKPAMFRKWLANRAKVQQAQRKAG